MANTGLQATNLTAGQAIKLETSALPGGVLALVATTAVPDAQYNTLNQTTGSIPAADLTGANECYLLSINATPGAQLVPSAAALYAATPNAAVGKTWKVRILNTGAGTFTLTADAGSTVTITGHAAILTDTFVDYIVTLNSATTATFQSVGSGVAP